METREALEKFLSEKGVSAASFARSLGISSAALSSFRKGVYKGDVKGLSEKISNYLQNFIDKKEEREEIFPSKDKKIADFIINEGVRDREIVLITGNAGSGKSTIAKDYARKNPQSILIEATMHTTAKVLLNELCKNLGVFRESNLDESIKAIASELKRRDCVILIDEAEHLPVRALEDLRRIWDFSSTPIVLFGTEILMKNLMGKRGELRQLYSRIGGRYHLKGLEQKESDAFFGSFVYDYCLGNFRASTKLVARANRLMELSKGCVNRQEILKEASSMVILG